MRRRRRTAKRRKKEVLEASLHSLLENANVQRPNAESTLHSCFYSRHLGNLEVPGERGPWTTRCTEKHKRFFFFFPSPGNNGAVCKDGNLLHYMHSQLHHSMWRMTLGSWPPPQGVQLGVTSLRKNACHWYGWKTRCQFGCAGFCFFFCCCFFSLGVMGIIYITGMKYDT